MAVVETIEVNQFHKRAADLGSQLMQGLRDVLAGVEGVTNIRGKGLMVGIELDRPCGELVQQALEQGLVLNVTAGNVIRLLPPLIIEREEIDLIVGTVGRLVSQFLRAA
jgi:acetylornithine/N-succinyldiaminopimelate aminotransferase